MIGTALIITLLVSVAAATPSLAQQQRIYPHIVEYIPAFSLAANDLQRLTVNQFKQITIGDVITTAYEMHTTQVILSYDGKSKHIQRPSPLKVLVTNDSFHLNIQFQVKVIHAVGSKSYSCSVQAPQVIVNYTKEVDFASGNTLITSLTSSYSSASFSQAVCQGTVGKNDKGAIESAVRSEGSSIYVQLKKTIDRMQSYMSINAGEERLSKIYAQNPYTYDFYGFRMDVNVSTVQATPFGETGIENSILGGIPFSTYPALPPPPYEQGFSSFYSLEFMRGMIEYTSSNYGAWRELRLTRSNMRTKVFQFRLLDFEPIMPSVLKRYPNKYLADVDICCAVQEIGEVTLDQQKLYVGIGWRCTGGFEGQDNNRVVFLNFLLRLKHSVEFTVASTSLSVRVSDLEIEGLEFEYIDEHKVVDPFTVGEYIRQDLFEFKVLTVGTFFKIASPNLKKKLIPERGMWIG